MNKENKIQKLLAEINIIKDLMTDVSIETANAYMSIALDKMSEAISLGYTGK